MKLSIRAIDAGFDPRTLKMAIDLSAPDIRTVDYDGLDGEPMTVSGSKAKIVGTLADAGYIVERT